MPDAPPRPPTLTMACLFVGMVSLFALLSVIDTLSTWTSLDTQQGLRTMIEDSGASLSSVSIDDLLAGLRVALFALVPITVSGVVLAIFAMRGDRPARVLLTALCAFGFLFYAALGIAGVLSSALLLASAFMLWSRDARRWYALKNGLPTPSLPTAPRPDPFAPRSSDVPPAQQSPRAPFAPVHPAAVAPAATPIDPITADRRPAGVLVAALVTGLGSLAALGGGLALLAMSTIGESVFREGIQDSRFLDEYLKSVDISVDTMLRIYLVTAIVIAALGLLGAVVGGLLLTRTRFALVAARTMSIVAIAVSILTLPLGLFHGFAAGYVLWLLFQPVNVAWFTRSGSPPPTRG